MLRFQILKALVTAELNLISGTGKKEELLK
jgi:hypothetical protein